MDIPMLMIAWTTVATRDEALRLSRTAVDSGRAVCCQVDGPIESVYRWQNAVETAVEYRITIKVLAADLEALETLIHDHHPYDTPEWVAVPATKVSEKYLNWAISSST
jgi:periplasmic divalent cation tolerance protein